MKTQLLRRLLLLLVLVPLIDSVRATTLSNAGHSLAEALNPDGTIQIEASGSFNARGFRMSAAPDGRPVFRSAGIAGAGDERWQDGFGLPNGTDGAVNVVVQSGSNIYIGGTFSIVGSVVANHIAKWNGVVWSALGPGVGTGAFDGVLALAVAPNGDVYAGGNFTQAGTTVVNCVARWNGTTWNSLGSGIVASTSGGLAGGVFALAITSTGDLYAGGWFNQAGAVGANNMAKWNGTAWSALGSVSSNGIGGVVYALATASNGEVYAGGSFAQAGSIAANSVARWNGTAWLSLGTGTANGINGGVVFTLALAGNGDVYAGGAFTQAGSGSANYVARWNGTVWSALGTNSNNGLTDKVNALVVASNGDVYAGGTFNQSGGAVANYLAKWNGTVWSAVGTGMGAINGVTTAVTSLLLASNGDLYAGGVFTQAGGVLTNYLAKWNGTAWSPANMGANSVNGLNNYVYAVAVASNGDIYVGGNFTQAGGIAVNSVAKWTGTSWSSLGAGTTNGVNGNVGALVIAVNGDLYVGGDFTQAGGIAASHIAKWNGTIWSSLGFGTANGVDGSIGALALNAAGEVYVGGNFTAAGGSAASKVAKWNGTSWSSLGPGLGIGAFVSVNALVVASNGDVYAGGSFTRAGTATVNYVAKWNGSAWSSLGNGPNGYVYSLAVASNGDIYVGGSFSIAGLAAANNVAKWNGAVWSNLGGLTNGTTMEVRTVALASNGDLYVGGFFTQAGGVAANRIAKWNGTAWSALGTGLKSYPLALAASPGGKIYAGGSFTAVGDGSKAMAYFGIYDPNAALATVAGTPVTTGFLFPNPAHETATLRLPASISKQPFILTDALGRTVRHYPAPAGLDVILDLRDLPAGIYIVRCGQLSQRLIVK